MVQAQPPLSLLDQLATSKASLTAKGRTLAEFIEGNLRRAAFMTARELAQASGVSESTVVRFVSQLGYDGYASFVQALRDRLDTELTLLERVQLSDAAEPGAERFRRVVQEEIDNLRHLFETFDVENLARAADLLQESTTVYVIGSRLSYTLAYYMGWSLAKFRPGVHILHGSDSIAIDWLTMAPASSTVVIVATTRYPNELIRLAKLVRRLDHTLLLIADSTLCPLVQFAHLALIAPSRHIPLVGSPSTLACLINCLIHEVAGRDGEHFRPHQERLEQAYLENDILFNP